MQMTTDHFELPYTVIETNLLTDNTKKCARNNVAIVECKKHDMPSDDNMIFSTGTNHRRQAES